MSGTSSLRVAEVELHVEDSGTRDGTPVVFLHGYPLTSSMWADERARVSLSRRTIAYDVRGLGRSGGAGRPVAFEWLVDDLLAVLEGLDVARAVLVGLSMGGYTALRFVEREPSRVAGLVLADTRSRADPDEARVKRAQAARRALEEGSAAFAEGFLPTVLARGTAARRPALLERLRREIAAQDPRALAALQIAMAGRTDTTAALPSIRVPTLVLAGAEDALTPPTEARALAAAIPGATLEEIPDAGHFSNLENPEAFGSALDAFLEQLR